ncbi:MAG TPA: GntR family transcriptional regulator [Firmicutes bacterium]|nr:GntR family transcriptional regulator [Bacillota bacterium]
MAASNPGLLVNPKSGIPLYVQLKNQIRHFITAGVWEPGLKLPTERELAETLGVSRNTVSAAYKELESEGLLVSLQGRGTFVAGEAPDRKKTSRKERLLKIIDLALEEAAELGFNPDDFLALTVSRARERKQLLSSVRLAFVSPTAELSEYFRQELAAETGVQVLTFPLSEVRNRPEGARREWLEVDLIVTTLAEADEVRHLVYPLEKPVVGAALELELETIVRIARLPEGSVLAVVSRERAFARSVSLALRSAGISGIEIRECPVGETETRNSLTAADAIACSVECLSEVKEYEGKKEIIPLQYRLDTGSLNMLRALLLELKKQDRAH